MSSDDITGSYQQEPIDLYALLPALYRIRDLEHGQKLKALLDIISNQANIIHRDIAGLWDDFFIETCRPWIIPYIADLVGNNPLHEVAAGLRVDVAKTIYYRRRKGTSSMLEEMAGDVTGWGAHVAPFFELLGWTQNLNHLRYQLASEAETDPEKMKEPYSMNRVGSVNLRDMEALDLLDGPHDIISHSVDVRHISCRDGWYGIRKIGFFLWRLRSYPLGTAEEETPGEPNALSQELIEARRSESCSNGYYFSPLGNPMPLFNKPGENTNGAGLSEETCMCGPIRPLTFSLRKAEYYGPNQSLCIFIDGKQVEETSIVCQDLSDWDNVNPAFKEDIVAAVDTTEGRILFSNQIKPKDVKVCYSYGFSSDIGGGPYERRDSLSIIDKYLYVENNPEEIEISVSMNAPAKYQFGTIHDAIDYWATNFEDDVRKFVITILDNATYEEDISLRLPSKKSLVIRAKNGKRPHLKLKNEEGILNIHADTEAELTLNGLLIEGAIHIEGSPKNLNIVHCTLVPGLALNEDGEPKSPDEPSIKVEEECTSLRLLIDHSIVGMLCLPSGMVDLTAIDSIIDGGIIGNTNTPGALVSGILLPCPTIGSDTPAVNVTIGKEGPFLARFKHKIVVDIEEAGTLLQAAIREAHRSPAFEKTTVEAMNNRLMVRPGKCRTITIEPSENDKTTARELKLDEESATFDPHFQKIDQSGPPVILEHVTVIGKVHVKEMRMTSDVIFTDIVHCERQQAGWIRFSYVPEDSKTPRRYRCQPDMALDALEEVQKGELNANEREAVCKRMKPSFSSVRYGNPAYAQLSLNCAEEIRKGAEDGSEMGAFCNLKQPQREANLRIRLEEYLPFGLEAGIIYVN